MWGLVSQFVFRLSFFQKNKMSKGEKISILPFEEMGGEAVGGVSSVLCEKRQINAFLSKVGVAMAPFSTGQGGQQVC